MHDMNSMHKLQSYTINRLCPCFVHSTFYNCSERVMKNTQRQNNHEWFMFRYHTSGTLEIVRNFCGLEADINGQLTRTFHSLTTCSFFLKKQEQQRSRNWPEIERYKTHLWLLKNLIKSSESYIFSFLHLIIPCSRSTMPRMKIPILSNRIECAIEDESTPCWKLWICMYWFFNKLPYIFFTLEKLNVITDR